MAQFPWPRDSPSFERQKEAIGARRSAGPPSPQTAPAPAGDARTAFFLPPPAARSFVVGLNPGHALSIASLLLRRRHETEFKARWVPLLPRESAKKTFNVGDRSLRERHALFPRRI